MSYFLSDKSLKAGEIVELTGEEARHILLSRRIEIGEIIKIQGPDAKRFMAEVILIDRKSPSSPAGRLSIQALEEIAIPDESPLSITIFQALIKEQPLDFIIQKATELGVDKLVLFNSQNSVDRFKDIEKKLGRWRKIGDEASKQSDRGKSVLIEYLDDVIGISKISANLDRIFLLEPSAKEKFSTWTPARHWLRPQAMAGGPSVQVNKVGILVGPEGGFTEDEVTEFLKIKNLTPISMGPRILRADTASIAGSAIIQAMWGDL